ncbi:unnamed protein product [marine sediment metagenome]|uniref:ArnR1-like winged helix-turn-helix domain-containing protein n=1 Tax=marine sediment metagenome TaxID=412755 RepID=X1F7I8_9ZZZZ
MKTKRRNDLDICADILKVATGGARKTRIVYQANLNFRIVKGYLERLIELGLLCFEAPCYHATPRGSRFVDDFERLFAA